MPVRLMTYNILDGGISRETYILEVIQGANPDLIVIQEVTDVNILRSLGQTLNMEYLIGKGNRERKVALLSRLPIENFRSNHPIFPIWRNFIEANIKCPSGESIRLVGVHLIANPWIGFELWRLLEIQYITKYIQPYSNYPCVMAGDFNAVAPKDRIITSTMPIRLRFILWLQGNRMFRFAIRSLISSEFVDGFRLKHPHNDGFTLPPPVPNIRLDYFFINKAMERHIKDCWVVRDPKNVEKASDHYPVMIELNL
jgi:endonuclease/exonuclease/phosphatase family metal-dependent hydrolase